MVLLVVIYYNNTGFEIELELESSINYSHSYNLKFELQVHFLQLCLCESCINDTGNFIATNRFFKRSS